MLRKRNVQRLFINLIVEVTILLSRSGHWRLVVLSGVCGIAWQQAPAVLWSKAEAVRHFSSTERLLTFGVLIEAEFVRAVIYKLVGSARSQFIASTRRTIKLSARKEPFDVDGLVTGADKLLSSPAIARVDSHLHQSELRVVGLHSAAAATRSPFFAVGVMLTSHKRRICDQSRHSIYSVMEF